MRPVGVKYNTYINFGRAVNDEDPKFQVGDYARISKYKNIFTKKYTRNCSEEFFVISKIKNAVPSTYVIKDLNSEEINGAFYEKELRKTNQEKLRVDKVITKKGNEFYVKWKGYDNSFNSSINQKDIVK